MRLRGSLPLRRAAPLEQDDRLGLAAVNAPRLQAVEQRAPVGDAFQIQADDAGARIAEQLIEDFDHRYIGAIADGQHAGEAKAARLPSAQQIDPQTTALRDDPERPGHVDYIVHEGDPRARRMHAQAIGADDPHAPQASTLEQLRLQRLAAGDLRKPAGHHLRERQFSGGAGKAGRNP